MSNRMPVYRLTDVFDVLRKYGKYNECNISAVNSDYRLYLKLGYTHSQAIAKLLRDTYMLVGNYTAASKIITPR